MSRRPFPVLRRWGISTLVCIVAATGAIGLAAAPGVSSATGALSLAADRAAYGAGALVTLSGTLTVNDASAFGSAVALQINGPSGLPQFLDQVYTDPSGIFSASWFLSATATLGTYQVRAGAMGFGAQTAFEVLSGGPPEAQTLEPSETTTLSARLSGSVVPNGQETVVWFEWGLDGTLSLRTPSQTVGAGTSSLPVTAFLDGLSPNTTYGCRLVAENILGQGEGSIQMFTTPAEGAITLSLPLSPGWNMVTLPLILPSTNPNVVFSGLPAGWRLFSWDALNSRYRDQSQTTLTLGQGFWLKVSIAVTYAVSGLPNLTPESAISLFPGWNMIGSPYHQDVSWSQVSVRQDGGSPVSLDQAAINGWIRSPLYTWVGSAYAALATGGTFQPLRGYWLKAVSSGLTIIFTP